MAKRLRWSSNVIYILAAIGCAAGLGNLRRFPMLAYEYGGSAFIIALLVANVVIVFPLMMVETMIGQKFQAGGPKAMHKMFRGSGRIMRLPVLAALFVLMYYIPVMGWGINYFFDAFTGQFLADPSGHFMNSILGLTDSITIAGNMQRPLFFSVILGFILIVAALRKSIKSASKVLKRTVIAPFILLIILGIRGMTLPGGMEGLAALFVPDRSGLLNIELWQAAIGQAFFSASLAFGYFIIAGSYRKKNAEVPKTSLWIIIGNLVTSLLAGIAVFSTIGFMAQQQGVPIADAANGGPMLVFSVLPEAIAAMPFFKIGFALLLFIVVITLAIDSIFGLVEIIVGSFMDLKAKYEKQRRVLLPVLGLIFLGAIPFTLGAGLYYLDILDHFVGGYIFMIIGFLEAAVVTYFVRSTNVRKWINETATGLRIGKWFDVVLFFIPKILLVIIAVTIYNETQQIYGGYPADYVRWIGGVPLIAVFVGAIILNYFTRKKERLAK